jgi:hypothetical protein
LPKFQVSSFRFQVTETEVSAVAREVKVVQSFSSFWIWERGVSARDELAAKKRKRPQKTEAPLLKIGLAFLAAIESGYPALLFNNLKSFHFM